MSSQLKRDRASRNRLNIGMTLVKSGFRNTVDQSQ